MAKTAFISYATDDESTANAIATYLERNQVSCWIAPRDVSPGEDYAAAIIDGIESSAVFVLVLSEHANESKFVKREVERAVSKGKPVFPVRVREVAPSKSLELFISSTEWIDAWQPPLEQYLGRLAESIRSAAAVYPPGRAPAQDRATAGAALKRASPPDDSRPTRRPLFIAIAALVAIVGVLGALLVHNMGRPPASVASVDEPTRPRPAEAAHPSASTADVATAPTAPIATAGATLDLQACPVRLSINRDLPTPFRCRCSAESTAQATVWGTDVYTDDSALCRAALHAGVISAQGGPITVLRRPGRALYVGTTRGGVSSNDYGAYAASIVFDGAAAPPPGPQPCPVRLSINRELPTPFTCRCTASATLAGSVWGTDAYTDDSALCAAARHAGRIGPDGGTITVVRGEGRPIYVGSSRGGVASHDYGAYPASIAFR